MNFNNFSFVLIGTFLALSVTIKAEPKISEELSHAFMAQQQRALNHVKDVSEFKKDLKPLADRNDPVAQFYYAMLLEGELSNDLRIRYLQASANEGCAGAAGVVAMHYLKVNKAMGRFWLMHAAENGDAMSQVTVASTYLSGENGFKKDPVASYGWLLLASEQTYDLGLLSMININVHTGAKEYSQEVERAGKSYYLDLKKKYGIKPFYMCGQSLPGNNRVSGK